MISIIARLCTQCTVVEVRGKELIKRYRLKSTGVLGKQELTEWR